MAKVAALRVYPSRNGLPEDSSCWLFMRRTPDGQMKYAISNAPEDMPFSELCEAATMRWPIEQCFEEGKSHLGMGDYEHRSWPAWHRHMIYVFLALHFLLGLRLTYKKTPALTLPQAQRLIAAVLPMTSLKNRGYVLQIVAYHTIRNFVAYRSHRKKSNVQATRLFLDVSL